MLGISMIKPLPHPIHTRIDYGDRVVCRSYDAEQRAYVYSAYEPIRGHTDGLSLEVPAEFPTALLDPTTARTYAWFGRLGTRPLPPTFLPENGTTRRAAWDAAQHAEAEALIRTVFPETKRARSLGVGQLRLRHRAKRACVSCKGVNTAGTI